MNLVGLAVCASFLILSTSASAAATSDPEEQARMIIREGADSKNPTVRVQAIQAVGLIGMNDYVRGRLEKFLTDGNVDVRIAAIKALEDQKSTASLPAIEKVLKEDKVPEVQFAAAKALYAFQDAQGRAFLVNVFTGNQRATSSAISSQSRKFFSNFHSLGSSSSFILSQGLGFVPVPGVGQGFSAVTGLLEDPKLSPRATSLMLVARDKDPQIDRLLRTGLNDKDWSVRAAAAQMIAFTARISLREDLVPLLSDKSDKVRFRAAGAYLHLAMRPNASPTPPAPARR